MQYTVEPRKVAGVVAECNRVIIEQRFNHGEVVLGLSELLGRIIVDTAQTHIQADELYKLAQQHIVDTIKVGSAARGKSLTETSPILRV